MEKVVIVAKELDAVNVSAPGGETVTAEPARSSAIPRGLMIAMWPLILVLPILCIATIVIRVTSRGQSQVVRHARLEFLSMLLVISGLVTTVAGIVAFGIAASEWSVPAPPVVTSRLAELDAKDSYPALPAERPLATPDIARELKPLVAVISPARKAWFSKSELPSRSFGAGVLIWADRAGYLFLTARHVIEGATPGQHVMVAMQSGSWTRADVIASHSALDLALLSVARESGNGTFLLPVRERVNVSEGENIVVIGHPQGLRFTLSTGIISRKSDDTFQISAPVSPGNSGGPAFDERGNLAGIVTSMVDRETNPNAENLNFAAPADAALRMEGWRFSGGGQSRLQAFLQARSKVSQ